MYSSPAELQVERIRKGLDQHQKELKQNLKSVDDILGKPRKTKEQLQSLRFEVVKLIEKEEAWRGWFIDANKILAGLPNPLFAETTDLQSYVKGEAVDASERITQLRQVLQNIEGDMMGAGSRIRGKR